MLHVTSVPFPEFDSIRTIKTNAFKFLKFCKSQYDIIFSDPPYDIEGIDTIPILVFKNNLLKPGGWLIVEHSKSVDLSGLQNFFDKRQYGNVNFSFYKKED